MNDDVEINIACWLLVIIVGGALGLLTAPFGITLK